MFECHHHGQCCEDPVTQINLTLGDLQRLTTSTQKSTLQLYKDKIIGIQPFGDPENNTFETDIGLLIPCQFREMQDGTTKCSMYKDRPLNCRLFPYWILADAPILAIKDIAKESCKCLQKLEMEGFEQERQVYREYKEKLASLFHREEQITEMVYGKLGVHRTLTSETIPTKKEQMREVIGKLVLQLQQQDFSELFTKLDQELQHYQFTKAEDIPTLPKQLSSSDG